MLTLFALLLVQQSEAPHDHDHPPKKPALAEAKAGDATLRLIDVSLDVILTAGTSTARDAVLEQLQSGGHDPKQRGFSLTQAELYLAGAVDPYLEAQAYVMFHLGPDGESEVELEEAFAVTQTLPVELKAGLFLTEFGRINPSHPHAWTFVDQPIAASRILGPEGLRAPGLRAAYDLPFDWKSRIFVGLQQARGEGAFSFFGEPSSGFSSVGGFPEDPDEDVRSFSDLVLSARWAHELEARKGIDFALGASFLNGPNDTGGGASTRVVGLDLALHWHPEDDEHGWPFVLVEAEVMARRYEVESADDLEDWGFSAHAVWGFVAGWSAGARIERFESEGESAGPVDPDDDPTRDARTRFSAILSFCPSDFSRLRLQYNFDRAESLRATEDDDVSTVWLSVEFVIGTHRSHEH